MAKKKLAARSPKNKERKAPGFTTKAIRMSEAYAEWVEEYSEKKRASFAGLVDRLLAEGAEADGFKAPPKRIP